MERVPHHGDILLGHSGLTKSLEMCDSTPQVMGLMKPSGGGGVNAELILNNCDTNDVGSFGNPVAHHDPAAGFGDSDHFPGDIVGFGANMAPNTESVRSNDWSRDPLQVARITLLKFQPG